MHGLAHCCLLSCRCRFQENGTEQRWVLALVHSAVRHLTLQYLAPQAAALQHQLAAAWAPLQAQPPAAVQSPAFSDTLASAKATAAASMQRGSPALPIGTGPPADGAGALSPAAEQLGPAQLHPASGAESPILAQTKAQPAAVTAAAQWAIANSSAEAVHVWLR